MITGDIVVLRPPAQTTPASGLVAGPAGESAYQLALGTGFTGTLAQWLASLVGATGGPGATGATGPQGATGPTPDISGKLDKTGAADALTLALPWNPTTFTPVVAQDAGNDVIRLATCYGATTQDKVATAIAYLWQAGSGRSGGTIELPRGTTPVDATVTGGSLRILADAIKLRAHGTGASTLYGQHATADVLVFGDGAANPKRCGVEGMTIAAAGNRTGGAGLRFSNTYDAFGRHLSFAGMTGGRSVQIDGGSGAAYNAYRTDLRDVITFDGVDALVIGEVGDKPPIQIYLDGLVLTSCSGSAFKIRNASGLLAARCETLFAGISLDVGAGQGVSINALQFDNCMFDTPVNENVKLATGGTGWIWNVVLQMCRLSSAGTTYSNGAPVLSGKSNLLLAGAAAGMISGIRVLNSDLMNAGGHGFVAVNADDLTIAECNTTANGQASPGSYAGGYIDGTCRGSRIVGGRIGPCYPFGAKTHNVSLLYGSGSNADRHYLGGGIDLSGAINGKWNQAPPGANSVVGDHLYKPDWP